MTRHTNPSSASRFTRSCGRRPRSSAAAARRSAPAQYSRLSGLPGPSGRAAGAEPRGSGLRDQGRARARLRDQERRSSRARTTSIPTCRRGYQISQYERPLATAAGSRSRPTAVEVRRLTRIHLEEDAGKSLHEGFPDSDRRPTSTTTAAACRSSRSSPNPTCDRPRRRRRSSSAARDPRVARRQRRQHGRGQPALRRERVGAPGRVRRRSAPRRK